MTPLDFFSAIIEFRVWSIVCKTSEAVILGLMYHLSLMRERVKSISLFTVVTNEQVAKNPILFLQNHAADGKHNKIKKKIMIKYNLFFSVTLYEV